MNFFPYLDFQAVFLPQVFRPFIVFLHSLRPGSGRGLGILFYFFQIRFGRLLCILLQKPENKPFFLRPVIGKNQAGVFREIPASPCSADIAVFLPIPEEGRKPILPPVIGRKASFFPRFLLPDKIPSGFIQGNIGLDSVFLFLRPCFGRSAENRRTLF